MNWPTFLIATLVAAVFLAIVIAGIHNKKKGKHNCSCGGNCGACGILCSENNAE